MHVCPVDDLMQYGNTAMQHQSLALHCDLPRCRSTMQKIATASSYGSALF